MPKAYSSALYNHSARPTLSRQITSTSSTSGSSVCRYVNYHCNSIELVRTGPSTESQDANNNNDMDIDEGDNPVDDYTPSTEIRGQIKELPGIQIVAKPQVKRYQNLVCCNLDLFIACRSHG